MAPALVTAGDLIEYDLDGNPVSDKRQGYQERFIHAAIYKARPDVKSVVHAHTPSLLVFTRPDRVFIQVKGFADRETVAQAAANAS